MMRKFISLIFMVGVLQAGAADLQTVQGTVFHNVTIISVDPERMLIVHDGGGCQVDLKDIKPDSLTPEQRSKVEEELSYYVLRAKRLELMRLETEEFEAEQRHKGLVEFEDGWVTPLQREEILISREERKVELERKRVLLAKEKVELEKEQLQTDKARHLLEGESRRGTTYITYGYTSSFRRDCGYLVPYNHRRGCAWPKSSTYITRDGAAGYNRGPFHR